MPGALWAALISYGVLVDYTSRHSRFASGAGKLNGFSLITQVAKSLAVLIPQGRRKPYESVYAYCLAGGILQVRKDHSAEVAR